MPMSKISKVDTGVESACTEPAAQPRKVEVGLQELLECLQPRLAGPDFEKLIGVLKLVRERQKAALEEEGVQPDKRAFVHDQSKVVKAVSATEVAEDLRKCHFNFGYDGTVYETDAMRNQRNILQAGDRDLKADRENQRSMKANLMKTNLSLIHDEHYT